MGIFRGFKNEVTVVYGKEFLRSEEVCDFVYFGRRQPMLRKNIIASIFRVEAC
jgi:hypothetical protein